MRLFQEVLTFTFVFVNIVPILGAESLIRERNYMQKEQYM